MEETLATQVPTILYTIFERPSYVVNFDIFTSHEKFYPYSVVKSLYKANLYIKMSVNNDFDDFSNFLGFLENLENLDNPQHRPRIIRPRGNPLETMDDCDFFKRYRVSKEVFLFILHKIDENLEYESDRNNSISPALQLMVALRFYATGSHLMAIGDIHGIHNSTVSRIVKRVSHAIVGLRHEFIRFPSTEEEITTCHREFYTIARFPHVIGTIDCTHVKIQSPGGIDAELFRNRKGYFSINVQTVSDAQTRVLNVVARWPGSTHDSAIFTNSRICQDFESGLYRNSCLLGDSGYPLKHYLLTPYLNPRTPAEENYNTRHIKTRNTVERQYGIIKRRFPLLAYGLRIKLDTAIDVIISCCILHNVCIQFRIFLPLDQSNEEMQNLIEEGQIHLDVSNQTDGRGIDRRALFTFNYFNNQ